jgi:hypothetical protein
MLFQHSIKDTGSSDGRTVQRGPRKPKDASFETALVGVQIQVRQAGQRATLKIAHLIGIGLII